MARLAGPSILNDQVNQKIAELLDRAETVSLVQSIRMLLKYLKAHNLSDTMRIVSRLVGFTISTGMATA